MNPATLAGVAAALEHVAAELRAAIERETDAAARAPAPALANAAPVSWRERIWHVPADTRLDMREAAEALNRSRSWLAARLHPPDGSRLIPIPHRKRDGTITFLAGELRTWQTQTETIEQLGAMETAIERATARVRRRR